MKPNSSVTEKTLADYLAMAVGPVLIMLMVGSLVFFLVDVAYRGQFAPQVRWTLFWFILASVLVSRISIEQGSSYGSLYGLALGVVTSFRIIHFLGLHLGALLLLGLIWWCASKLTWDCTLIDEKADASGEGLWQRAGFGRGKASLDQPTGPARERAPESRPEAGRVGDKPPHAPGLWVIYFSLGALPVFGFGHGWLPAGDAGARLGAFMLLWVYVASALGLLLTTSFLGLRRYLRQRHLRMPTAISRSWMIHGTGLALTVLLGALVLPRPEGADTLARLGAGITERTQQASRHAWQSGNAAEGKGRPLGEGNDNTSDPAREQAERGESAGDTQQTGEAGESPGNSSGANPSPSAANDRGSQNAPGPDRATPSAPELTLSPVGSVTWLRWITYAIGALVLMVVVVRFGRQWMQALRQARARRAKVRPIPTPLPKRMTAAFAAYENPFHSGWKGRLSTSELTVYTFRALQAWATDKGWERRPEETPAEFGHALAGRAPEISDEVLGSVGLYLRVAYAGAEPGPESVEVLERLWLVLQGTTGRGR